MENIMNEIVVKYFSARMLDTLDLNQLFQCLFDKFGDCQIRFVPMTQQEKSKASTKVNEIEAVSERYWVFHHVDNEFVRQRVLEEAIVRTGQK